jgi:hypothetical protein
MPISALIRFRLIKIVRNDRRIARQTLLRRINAADRSQAEFELGKLLSEGVFITVGRGERGDPVTILPGPLWPADHCPFCNQTIDVDSSLLGGDSR